MIKDSNKSQMILVQSIVNFDCLGDFYVKIQLAASTQPKEKRGISYHMKKIN